MSTVTTFATLEVRQIFLEQNSLSIPFNGGEVQQHAREDVCGPCSAEAIEASVAPILFAFVHPLTKYACKVLQIFPAASHKLATVSATNVGSTNTSLSVITGDVCYSSRRWGRP